MRYYQGIQNGAVDKMETQKLSESKCSSSGEILKRAKTKTEKNHQKITLPTFEKRGIQEAKLWWRRFTQNMKMTQNIELKEMTTDREILPDYRDDLEHRIKDLFIWAIAVFKRKRSQINTEKDK